MKFYGFILLFLFSFACLAQKVGVVLSGGGAAGSAHIGVLKALEENNIPIDYITGTSIGALVGGFYAAGYSIAEIEAILSSSEFRDAANGIVDEQYSFYLNESEDNPTLLSLSFDIDSIFSKNIPTNFVSSNSIDYGLMGYFSAANAAADENFDSLMIPFRCLASNISKRKQTVFKLGNLSTAIRASMTYPFYLAPITIDGDIMFDGGLYNNFPADVLCEEFNPDYIIASNVASLPEQPTEEDLISQIKSILTKESRFEINCAKGIIINSDVNDISTFDFYEIDEAIDRGYNSTLALIDSIKKDVHITKSQAEVKQQRDEFNIKKPALNFNVVAFKGLKANHAKYFRQSLKVDSSVFPLSKITPKYFKVATNEKIERIYPWATYNKESGNFELSLEVKKEKHFKASFGGVIATKPFSTGFFELEYQLLQATGLKASGNIYFGSFYGAAEVRLRWDVPFDIPFYLESQFTVNRYDYFNGRSTFIEEDDPPYIITSERYWESKLVLPILTKGKLAIGTSYIWQELEYYQNDNFERGDTADYTRFEGLSTLASYSRNSLNRKMYATKGSKLDLKFRFIDGRERTQPGSLALSKDVFSRSHDWLIINGVYEKYFFSKGDFRLGTYIEGTYSDQPFFQNYTATLLNAPSFTPLPLGKTIFQEQYRARSFGAVGLKSIYTFRELIDFRLEGYIFQPYEEFIEEENAQTSLGEEVTTRNFIGSITTVYHSRLGPVAVGLNYFDDADEKFSFLLHFGYVIFNKKGME